MRAAALIRSSRRDAGLTQAELARAAGTSQSAIARYESGTLDPSTGTLTRLLAASGRSLEMDSIKPGRIRVTAASAAVEMAAELQGSPDRPRAALRPAYELIDEFLRASRGRQTWMINDRPPGAGDRRLDAFIAGLVEHLCSKSDLPSPGWVHDHDRFLDAWWFVAGLRGFEAAALAESPVAFARRGVFITAGALDRV